MREAASVPMIKYLNKKKCEIRYYDPSGEKKEFKNLKNVKYFNNINTACLKTDLIIIHTEWNDFKLLNFKKLVKKNNFSIYDLRNIYSPKKMRETKNQIFCSWKIIYFNSKIASTSTDTPNGRLFVLTAALVCIPASPKIKAIKSEAPLITFGCSIKSSVEFTKPVSLIHDFIFDKSSLHAFLV